MYGKDKELVPEVVRHVCKCLKLPINACSPLSSDRLTCVVPVDWLKTLHRYHVTSSLDYALDACTLERFLSKSCESLPLPWKRISVKVLTKSDDLYEGLSGDKIEKHWCCGSLYEFMSHVAVENVNNLWLRSHRSLKTSQSHQGSKNEGLKLSSLMKQLILRLGPSVYVNMIKDIDDEFTAETDDSSSHEPSIDNQSSGSKCHSRGSSFYTTVETYSYQGMVPIDAVIETEEHFFLVQPYLPYTFKDVVAFSPSILENSHAKSLFIVYQLLQAMHSLHAHGLCLGNAHISSLLMDKNMWLRVCGPRLSTLKPYVSNVGSPVSDRSSPTKVDGSQGLSHSKGSCSPVSLQCPQPFGYPGSLNEIYFQSAREFLQTEKYKYFEIEMLPSIVDGWINRSITNFQYLMILNHLAGRRMGDPNNHPVLPWVMDFSAPDSGYRDLTKSKFRLNKGDGQLDFTFNEMQELHDGTAHVPHHVSDILSDITYYVYTARRTPKIVLCAHVRSNWVPHEYPQSMHRLQGWTPDECIPEFFTDPTIFDSIHDDLPDLEIPVWCKNTLDFVIGHLAALESDQVSSNLHQWIDLTFGYKLTGLAAERAKNVHLHLVDKHTNLMSHGATQLFQEPHPQRAPNMSTACLSAPRVTRGLLESQLQTYGFPNTDAASSGSGNMELSESGQVNQTAIHLPLTFNPLADLERCETNLRFSSKVLHTPTVPQVPSPQDPSPTSSHEEEMTQDMVVFLCLMCEMLLDSKLRMQDSRPALFERVKTLRKLCCSDFLEIQRPFQRFIREMFDNLEITAKKTFTFQTVFPDGSPPPTPTYLLQPYSDLIPFPPYFNELFTCLSKIVDKSREIQHLQWSRLTVVERINKSKQLEREKVPILENFLWKHQGYLGAEGMGLLLPYIQDLLHNQYTTVQAAWSLFNAVARELGPVQSAKQFLPQLTALFSGEVTSAKHIKLYHRSFLMQLIVRLGLKQFLTNFSTLLVEAVAGYKDFSVLSKFYPEELMEDLNHENLMKSTNLPSSGPLDWTETGYSHPSLSRDVADGEALEEEEEDFDQTGQHESDDISDTIVDRMSLNGDHVLLEEEDDFEIDHSASRQEGETDSVTSETSEDRELCELTTRRRAKSKHDEIEGNVDQHSIHSISLLIPKTERESSPSLNFDQDVEGEMHNEVHDRYPTIPHRKKNIHERSSESELDNLKEGSKETIVDRVGRQTLSQSHHEKSVAMKESKITAGNKVEEESSSEKQSSGSVTSEEISSKDNVEGKTCYNDQRPPFQRYGSKSDMVRSETEDLMMSLSAEGTGSIINIRDISADSVKWLCHKLGPVLATKFLSRNLLRMLALCYLGEDQLQFVEYHENSTIKTSRLVSGDINAQKVLECITFTAVLYGEQIILIQCLPNIMDMITMAQKRLTLRSESGLISCLVMLCCLLPYMSDTSLMDVLQDSIIASCINPVLTIISSQNLCFPSGVISRFVLCHKLVDLLYCLGLRLGFEMTRKFLNPTMLRLFSMFSTVHGQSLPSPRDLNDLPPFEVGSGGSDDSFLNIKMDALTLQYHIGSPVDLRTIKYPPKRHLSKIHSLSSIGILDDKDDYIDSKSNGSTAEKCAYELKCVFCPELAQACYIPLCRIFGSIHMEENLRNDDLIRQLCSQHDLEMDRIKPEQKQEAPKLEESNKIKSPVKSDSYMMSPMEESDVVGGIGSNVAIVGNRIQLHEDTSETSPPRQELSQFGRGYKHSGILKIRLEELRSSEMDQNTSRHLSGNWLAYWERELGLHERNTMFNFMQIELQTFSGHTNSIRSIHSMDTENCFISASKDKTVRLWSINNSRNSAQKQSCQYCYTRHKKSVFSVAYVDSMRLVASCDSTVHVWDPYTGVAISQLESPRYSPVIALTALPAPSTLVAMATNENTLRFLDMRTSKYTHSFRTCVGNSGLIRCIAVSPDGSWIAAGFTTGYVYILDINSGILSQFWKAHDSEILQLKAYTNSRLLSSAFDQTIKLWNVDTGQESCPTKVQSEAVHCMCLYRDQLITATPANKISIYSSVQDSNIFSGSKLRSSAFKGVLTHMSVLPLNKALLLGADNGAIHLMT